MTNKDYEALRKISTHIKRLQGALSLIQWDQETYMPKGAIKSRSEQIESLSGVIHKETTSKKYQSALSKLIDLKTGKILQTNVKPEQKAALREWRRDFIHATALPDAFVEAFSKLSSEGMFVWEEARKRNDFNYFLPHLQKTIDMCRKKADYLGYQDHPYDALLDQFEPDMKTAELDKIFKNLRLSLTDLIKRIEKKKPINDSFLWGNFSKSKQMEFNEILMDALCYDRTYGRLDLSEHPFSSASHPTDSRITSRIHMPYLLSNIRSVMHEVGHGLYEMGLPIEQFGTPLGESISLGIHESQSRWWETRIGLSKAFWKEYYPKLKSEFKAKLGNVPLDTFYRAINKVTPSMIRVEADEVTYPLHVILRFEIEKKLIEGSLQTKDIPDVWNSKMQEFLGITPKNDLEGCLQDVHWSMGAFGYFPTYALGNLFAAQFFEAFEKEFPKWESKVDDLSFMKEWLRINIHHHGRRYTSNELVKKVTGKNFSAAPFIDYLNCKYQEIYSLPLK
jgi:carboxypeptidase Taq